MNYNPYRKLWTIPGAAGFSAAAFLGRLPAGMIGLTIILPISQLTGSYTVAGTVAASTMLGMALCAPFSGRLLDRYGQSQILLIFAVLNFISTFALIACIQFGLPIVMLCVAGAVTGASRLSTGTIARIRWAYVIQRFDTNGRDSSLKAAYAFEAILDEVVFVFAPILGTFLCTAVHPLAGLICCLVSYSSGAVALAVQHSTQPAVEFLYEKQVSAFTVSGLQVIFAAILFIGISAGAIEVIVVARMDDLGSRSLTGFLMAALALSSMMGGFFYGTRMFKLPAHLLWIRCLGLLGLVLIPFFFASNLIALTLTLLIAGILIAPTAIAGQVLTEQVLPVRLLSEGMNIGVTAMIVGMAMGGGISGILIDKVGIHSAGALPSMAAFIAFSIVFAYRSTFA
jgi:hypothetical protein